MIDGLDQLLFHGRATAKSCAALSAHLVDLGAAMRQSPVGRLRDDCNLSAYLSKRCYLVPCRQHHGSQEAAQECKGERTADAKKGHLFWRAGEKTGQKNDGQDAHDERGSACEREGGNGNSHVPHRCIPARARSAAILRQWHREIAEAPATA